MTRRPVIALLMLGLLATGAFADEDKPEIAKLAVRGMAELEKPADQLRLSIGVISEGRDAGDVLDENSHRHAHGVSEDLKYSLRDAVELLGNAWVQDQKAKKKNTVKKNIGASIVDIGDGVLCLEVHTKMNTLDADVVEMMVRAVDLA